MSVAGLLIEGVSFKRIRRHFKFNPKEQKNFHISTLLISIIFFFFVWSFTNFNLTTGILTLIYLFLITAITLFLYISIPKIVAIIRGCEATYESWTIGLLSAFVVSFLFYGFISLIFPGNIDVKAIKRLKHGEVFHHETKEDIFAVLFSAPLTNIIIAVIFILIYNATGGIFIHYVILLNAMMAFISMLPLPKNIGAQLLYVKKKAYFPLVFFSILFLIAVMMKSPYAFLIGLLGVIISLVLAPRLKMMKDILE